MVTNLDQASKSMLLFLAQVPTTLIGALFLFLNNPFECRTWFISLVVSPEDFITGTSDKILVPTEFKCVMALIELFVETYIWSYICLFVITTFGFLCSTNDCLDKIK